MKIQIDPIYILINPKQNASIRKHSYLLSRNKTTSGYNADDAPHVKSKVNWQDDEWHVRKSLVTMLLIHEKLNDYNFIKGSTKVLYSRLKCLEISIISFLPLTCLFSGKEHSGTIWNNGHESRLSDAHPQPQCMHLSASNSSSQTTLPRATTSTFMAELYPEGRLWRPPTTDRKSVTKCQSDTCFTVTNSQSTY